MSVCPSVSVCLSVCLPFYLCVSLLMYVDLSIHPSLDRPLSISLSYGIYGLSPKALQYQVLRLVHRARYFRIIKVSTLTASKPLNGTGTDIEIPFQTARVAIYIYIYLYFYIYLSLKEPFKRKPRTFPSQNSKPWERAGCAQDRALRRLHHAVHALVLRSLHSGQKPLGDVGGYQNYGPLLGPRNTSAV